MAEEKENEDIVIEETVQEETITEIWIEYEDGTLVKKLLSPLNWDMR